MKTKIFLILILVNCFATLYSRSFIYFPSDHFDIFYEEETKEQAVQLIEQGNEIYEKLSGFYNVELKYRLKVYLLAGVDFSNAYADFFSNAIVIYVNRNPVDYYDNSFEWWVPFVFSHELTHILIANKPEWIKSFLDIFGHPVSMLFDTAFTPSFFHEGISIYSESMFSEKGRLDDDRYLSYLSAEVQDSTFKGFSLGGGMNSPDFTPTGYNYLYGAFFVDYMEESYGEETVSKMVSDYGRIYRYNFLQMIEDLSGKSFTDFINDWKYWLMEKTSYLANETNDYLSENITNSGYYSGLNATNGKSLYYFSQKDGSITQMIKQTDLLIEERNIGIPVDFSVSPSGKSAFVYANSDGLEKYDLSLFFDTGNEKIRKNKMISHPAKITWQNDEVLLYTYLENGGTGLSSYNTVNEEIINYLSPSTDYYINNMSVEGTSCFMSISFNGNSDIYRLNLDNGEITQITQTPQNEIDVFIENGVLYFSSNRVSKITGNLSPYDIYALNLKTDDVQKLTSTKWGAYNPVMYKENLYYRGYSGKGFDLYKVIKYADTVVDNTLVNELPITEHNLNLVEDIPVSELIKSWDSERVLLPVPRFGIPFLFPVNNTLMGAAGIAGWDDLKEWIWYGYYFGFNEYRKWDYSLIHRGLPDMQISWNGDFEYEEIKTSLKFPFYFRESEDYLLLRPGIELGCFHTVNDLNFRMISDFSLYLSSGSIGYPNNPVRVPEFYQLIQLGTSGYYSQTGIGLSLPFSCTGLLRQRTVNGSTRLTAEGWYPFSHFNPIGSKDGKFRLSSLDLHIAGNMDINEDLMVAPSAIIGVWIDLGIQYWLDMKLILDFELNNEGFEPVVSIQNSIL
ncbi:MAG TPA: hypothetical protein PK466_00195 [Thermotogota bacterium]|nr:hypothetical protein [Thermotogota bacterium]HPJ87512.1 hypothetical protein [Thermotogota bacterium]HPR94717.1 hypothetical protein [Thermotogota bacterium]